MVSISTLKMTAVAVLLTASLGVASSANADLHLALLLPGGSALPFKHVALDLRGCQEVPPVKTHASGVGAFDVYSDGTVSGQFTTHRMRGTMAHIHQGAPGKNGPIVIALTSGPHDTWLVPAGFKLTPDQYKSFLAGDLYVNVHSAAHPDGEIRAQLNP